MKAFFKYILHSLLIFSAGCGFFDFEIAESKKIIGNIYVVNLNLPEHPGFLAVFLEKSGWERHLLGYNEYIDYLKSNDSVMLIKTTTNPDIVYYMINHIKGDSILNIQKLLDSEFAGQERIMTAKHFYFEPKK